MNKYYLIITLFFLIISMKCCSQQNNCYQRVLRSSLKNKIPKSVCISKNYLIRDIKSLKDLNNDGLEDFVFTYAKENIKDSDTLFVGIYTQKNDSTYVFKKKLGNLYPMFLKNYNSDIYLKKGDTEELLSYSGNYPLNKLEFSMKEIIIDFEIGAGETMELHFVYKHEKDNWFLEWGVYESRLTKVEEEILGENNGFVPVKEMINYNEEEQIPIDKFNYFDWL